MCVCVCVCFCVCVFLCVCVFACVCVVSRCGDSIAPVKILLTL